MRIFILHVVDFAMCCTAFVVLKASSIVVKFFRKNSPDQRLNVIVFANQAIGDTMIKVPFFLALRKKYPKDSYHVTLVLSRPIASAFSKLNFFEEVIAETVPPYRHALFWFFNRSGFVAKSLRWAFQNKAEILIACDRYRDLGIDFVHSLCKPTLSIAYDTSMVSSLFPISARFQRMFYDKKYTLLKKPISGIHQIEDTFSFLSFALGRKIDPSRVDVAELASMLDFSVAENYDLRADDYSVLVPGAAAAYRRWPTKRFAEVARFIGGKIVVVGSKEESNLAMDISVKAGLPVVNLCGKTDVRQLLGVISKAKIVISNETGAANCAAILGVKTVCILGGGDFGSFFPNKYCSNTVSVFHKDVCFSCGWNCKNNSFKAQSCAPCIDRISRDDVLHAIKLINSYQKVRI